MKRELTFIDRLRFMASSLDKLSSNLKNDQFVNVRKFCSNNLLGLLLRKVYDYVDSMTKIDETSLPPKEAPIQTSQMKVLQIKTISTLNMFGRNLILSQ